MKNRRRSCGVFLLVLFLAFPVIAQDTAQKIRVVVDGASVRLRPSMESEIIGENLPLGTLFDVEKKEDDWYVVKFRTRVGVLVTGYIHSMFVEEVKVTPEEKPLTKPVKPETPPAKTTPTTQPSRALGKRGGFFIGGGMAFGSSIGDSTVYSKNWNYASLISASEMGTITHKVKSPPGVGISFSYLFAGGVGMSLRLDYNLAQKFIADQSLSSYNLVWSWTTGGPYTREKTWDATGELSLMPVSLNVLLKAQGSGMFRPYFSGGVSYIMAKVKANSTRGYCLTWISGSIQYIDYLDLPVRIDKSLNSVGFNVGGGLDVVFSPGIALTIDGAYFIGKSIDERWEVAPGRYAGNHFPSVSWDIDAEGASLIGDDMAPLKVKLSFAKILLGLKFLF